MQLGFLFKKRQLKAKLQSLFPSLYTANFNVAAIPNSYFQEGAPIEIKKEPVNEVISQNFKEERFKLSKKHKKIIFIVVLILLIGLIGPRIFKNKTKMGNNQISQTKNTKLIPVNKKFTFPALDNQGKAAGVINFTITSAEKAPEVLVKDQTYKAKEGKLFLIINLELQNDSTNRLNIFPGDLIRLTTGDASKKFAPDLHNNMVMVAPISTKIDRVGFVIDSNTNNLKLLIGELEKQKTEIPLNF